MTAEPTEDLYRKIELFHSFQQSEGWKKIARLVHSKILMYLSSQRLVFITVNTEMSGRYHEIVNLSFVNVKDVHRVLFESVMHIKQIRKKYLRDPETENDLEPIPEMPQIQSEIGQI